MVPLSHAELSGHAVGLVLNHIRHEVWTQFDIGPPVASHIIVIGGREEGEDLTKQDRFHLKRQQQQSGCVPLSAGQSPSGCGRTRSPPVCTRGSG